MKTKRRLMVFARSIALVTSGCAGMVRPARDVRPIVDLAATGQPPEPFERDLRACNALAVQVDNVRQLQTVPSGALIGTLVGAVFGLRGNDLAAIAAGSVIGAVHNTQYAQTQT